MGGFSTCHARTIVEMAKWESYMRLSQTHHTSIEALYGFGALFYGQKRPDSSPLVAQNNTTDRPRAPETSFNTPIQLNEPP